jgi:hypothetical protein
MPKKSEATLHSIASILIEYIIPMSILCLYIHTHTVLSNIVGTFKTSQYHPTSLRISWEALQEDTVTGYTVQVVGPGSTREIPTRNKYSTFVEISDLSPFTQYTFKVNALKGIIYIWTKFTLSTLLLCIYVSSIWCSQ